MKLLIRTLYKDIEEILLPNLSLYVVWGFCAILSHFITFSMVYIIFCVGIHSTTNPINSSSTLSSTVFMSQPLWCTPQAPILSCISWTWALLTGAREETPPKVKNKHLHGGCDFYRSRRHFWHLWIWDHRSYHRSQWRRRPLVPMKANLLRIMLLQLQPYLPFIAWVWAHSGNGGRGARHGDCLFVSGERGGGPGRTGLRVKTTASLLVAFIRVGVVINNAAVHDYFIKVSYKPKQ